METRCRVTPGGGDPRESATEIRPPRHVRGKGETVRQERTAPAGNGGGTANPTGSKTE